MSTEFTALAKVRSRIRREIAEQEETEHEGGEINLVPYLDIITNTVIFMLATTALSLALANINVTAPRYVAGGDAADSDANPDDKPKLNLTVGITYTGFTIGGSAAILPKIPCGTKLRNGRCPAYIATRTNDRGENEHYWVDKYDYKNLAKKLKDIKLYKGPAGEYLYNHERQAIVTADRRVPFNVVVRTMDTLRGSATKKCTGDDGCLFDQVILSAGIQ